MYKLSPIGNFTQYFDNMGNPLSGGKIYTYAAGSSSIQQSTYSNSSGTPNANPIVLDSSGRTPSNIWIDDSLAYNFVLTKSDGTTVLMTCDGINQ